MSFPLLFSRPSLLNLKNSPYTNSFIAAVDMSERPNINLNFYDVHNPGFTVINSSVGAAYEEDRRRLGVPAVGADTGHESYADHRHD